MCPPKDGSACLGRRRSGKRSSPLDDIGPERWTWILEATLAAYPGQAKLLDQVLAGELIAADELPDAPESARKAPRIDHGPNLFNS